MLAGCESVQRGFAGVVCTGCQLIYQTQHPPPECLKLSFTLSLQAEQQGLLNKPLNKISQHNEVWLLLFTLERMGLNKNFATKTKALKKKKPTEAAILFEVELEFSVQRHQL